MGYCLTPASSVRREINGRNIPAVPATFGQSIAGLLTFSTGLVVGEGGGEVGGGGAENLNNYCGTGGNFIFADYSFD